MLPTHRSLNTFNTLLRHSPYFVGDIEHDEQDLSKIGNRRTEERTPLLMLQWPAMTTKIFHMGENISLLLADSLLTNITRNHVSSSSSSLVGDQNQTGRGWRDNFSIGSRPEQGFFIEDVSFCLRRAPYIGSYSWPTDTLSRKTLSWL